MFEEKVSRPTRPAFADPAPMSVPLAPPVSFPRGRESSDSAIGGWIAVVPWASGCTAASCTGAASAGVTLDPGSALRAVRDDIRKEVCTVVDDVREEVCAVRDDVEEKVCTVVESGKRRLRIGRDDIA